MIQQLSFLTIQFESTYKGPNWLGDSILSIIQDLSPEVAFKKPPGERHSIAEILKHMIVWKYFLVNRLSGDNISDVDQEKSFDVSIYGKESDTAFKKLLSDLDDCHLELISLLNNTSDEVLESQVAQREYTIEYLANGILQHDIYHLGQIAFLKKQLL